MLQNCEILACRELQWSLLFSFWVSALRVGWDGMMARWEKATACVQVDKCILNLSLSSFPCTASALAIESFFAEWKKVFGNMCLGICAVYRKELLYSWSGGSSTGGGLQMLGQGNMQSWSALWMLSQEPTVCHKCLGWDLVLTFSCPQHDRAERKEMCHVISGLLLIALGPAH